LIRAACGSDGDADDGAASEPGVARETGAASETGAAGETGAASETGAAGETGAASETGAAGETGVASETGPPVLAEPAEVELVLGWWPGSQSGGYYAAMDQGYFDEVGINMTITGGPVASPVQLVAAGRATFGIGDADEVLQARSEGIPILGLYPTYQKTPRQLVYHASNPVDSFEDLNGRTVYYDLGDAWWEFLKSTYNLTDVDEREYNMAAFLRDPTALIQAYAGDIESSIAEAAPDEEFGALDVGDSGWNPYSSMVFTSDDFVAENPDVVSAFLWAVDQGWDYYFQNYEAVNQVIEADKADASADAMNLQAPAQESYIVSAEGETGVMTQDRWEETLAALLTTGVLTEEVNVTEAFTTEFHPSTAR
jgi:NitT/TauT family transport system substrate-binding protein